MANETLYGEPPALPDGVNVRLYSMEYCPFAERARIALAFKNIPHDIVNCDLTNKPEFLTKANPNGQVPVLLHNGGEIYESEVVVEYVDAAFPDGPALYPKDPLKRAQGRVLISNQSSKVIPQFYKVGLARKKGEPEGPAIEGLYTVLQKWVEEPLAKSDGPFFLGKEITAFDFLIWPWLQRLDTLSKGPFKELKIAEKFPKLATWLVKLREQPAIQKTEVDAKNMEAFFEAYFADMKPLPYNLGSKLPFYSRPQAA